MATNDALNNSLAGQTGTGQYAGDTSPTLVTPEIGVATGTSLNLGSSTTITGMIDDDTFATASSNLAASSSSIKAYVDTSGSGLVDSVSGTANQVDVDNTDPANPILELSSTIDAPGTFTIQSSTAVDSIINDGTMATATNSNLSTSTAIKTYVDSIASGGFTVILTCLLGTTANFTATYANGAAGVGATLTNADTQVALTIDGVLTQVADRILVKDQTNEEENGVYTVTTVGDGTTNWVMTRATDYDTAAEIIPGTLVPVSDGTANGGSIWLETATVVTVGTDAVVFAEFAQPSNTYVTIATTQTVSGAKTFSNDVVLSGSSTLDLNGSTAVDEIIDDDSMATASATNLSTSEAIKAYVDASSGTGIVWTEVTGTTQAMSVNNGYIASNAATVVFTLPVTSSVGAEVSILGKGAGGWEIDQNAGQSIRIGSSVTTTGVTGNIASTNAFDSLNLICTEANNVWTCLGGPQGSITIV